jgi:hypothetical protein
MHPEIHINFLAVGAVVVANVVFGFVWYGPLFGKTWAKLMNFPPDLTHAGANDPGDDPDGDRFVFDGVRAGA